MIFGVSSATAQLYDPAIFENKRIAWAIGSDYFLNLSPTKPSPTSPDIKSKCLKSGGVGARS